MKVFIMTDVEGLPYVDSIDDVNRAEYSERYQKTKELLTKYVNYTSDLCYEYGASKVYFCDGHGGPMLDNVVKDMLSERARQVTVSEAEALAKAGEIDCVIELGNHARAGTVGGFLDHTVNSRTVFTHKVNGREESELSLHAAFFSEYSIPVAACIGDEAACLQAREYIKNIYVGAVKYAEERNFCQTYADADEIIRNTVREALKGYRGVDLYKVSLPAEVEITYYRTDMCEDILHRCEDDVKRTSARTLTKTVQRVLNWRDLNIRVK